MKRIKAPSLFGKVAALLLLVSAVLAMTSRETSALPDSRWVHHGHHCGESGRCVEWLVNHQRQGEGVICCEENVLNDYGGCAFLRDPDHHDPLILD